MKMFVLSFSENAVNAYLFFLQTILPAAAQDVFYRDEIGNISTSHLLVLDDSVEMEIRPRFPLFGGWKTHYIIGYNLPSYEYLFNLGKFSCWGEKNFLDHNICLNKVQGT